MQYLGIDTGGTFTDFVLLQPNQPPRVHKVLSTPAAPEQAILDGIRQLGLAGQALTVIHGSTVATNAVLEGKGVRTALITNAGLRDMLTIGRQARRELYNLQPATVLPPVPAELSLEVDCRLDAAGQVVTALHPEALSSLVTQLQKLEVEAVAVNLLFSYLDPADEQAIAAVLPNDLFVALSSEVLAEIGEYERGMATWLNAWVGPLIEGYVNRLQQGLGDCRLSIMQSSGETIAAAQAAGQAVRMLLSGPAGGLVGARFVAAASALSGLMTFDMGGTSTDVALLERDTDGLQLTSQGRIGDYPVAVPMVDMHTIGAGGGSIARLDDGGMLQVGPQSAGADPGPACYGKGNEPTVTDANLLLGRLPADSRLGGYLALDIARAQAAMQQLADRMQVSLQQAAEGIVEIANEHMAQALRVISVQRGHDPRQFTLVSFGGAGGLHACALADKLQMTSVLVPVHAGVLSALGMLATRPGRQLSRTLLCLLDASQTQQIETGFAELTRLGERELLAEGYEQAELSAAYSVDLRYQGQSHTLNLAWQSVTDNVAAFHRLHAERFGHALDFPVELVNLRVRLTAPGLAVSLARESAQPDQAKALHFQGKEDQAIVIARDQLTPGSQLRGPMIITEAVATTWLANGWEGTVDKVGNLLLTRASS